MKNAIKNYFEELIKTDDSIKAVYQESKLDGCCSYIQEQARKKLNGKNGYVSDEVVYHWARDFMLGDIEKPVETEIKETVVSLEKTEEMAAEALKAMDNASNTNAPTSEKLVIEKVEESAEDKWLSQPMREVKHPEAGELHQLDLFSF